MPWSGRGCGRPSAIPPTRSSPAGSADTRLLFLPRHGRGHRLLPSELPFRANVWALKSLGADCLLAVSAVGSLREEIAPGHVVVPDQFIDRTRGRQAESTFFGRGVVAHVQFADPFCPRLSRALVDAARSAGATVHAGGTYVCMEGPAFSTRAESHLYRSWGAHVIGMTNLQEAKLAREAELCFATLALATDYDCWHAGHDDVQIEEILKVLAANVDLARRDGGGDGVAAARRRTVRARARSSTPSSPTARSSPPTCGATWRRSRGGTCERAAASWSPARWPSTT